LAGKLAVLLAIVAFECPQIVFGQADLTTNDSKSLTSLQVTADSIEMLRKQTAESTELSDETKQTIEASCILSLDGLKRITELNAQASQFKKDTDDVQQRVAASRQQLVELQGAEPTLPTNLTLPELEQEVSRRVVELAELKSAQAKAEAEPSTRANRRREIRTLLLSANQRGVELQTQLDTPAPANEPNLLTTALRAELQVRRALLEAEQPALQNELAKYDAEDAADFVRLERDLITRKVTLATSALESLQQQLSRRRAVDLAAAVQRARDALAAAPEVLKAQAAENLTFAEAAYAMSPALEEAARNLDSAKVRMDDVQKALLRRQRVDLPNVRRRRMNVQTRKSLIEDTQYTLFDYDDLRSDSMEALLQQMLDEAPATDQAARARLESAARQLVEQRRGFLDDVIRTYNTYLDTLFELDATEQRLIRETERFQQYIDERIFWIRSNRILLSSIEIDSSDTWPVDAARWTNVGQQLVADIRSYPALYFAAVLAFGPLLWKKRRFRTELDANGQMAARGTCCDFALTLRAAYLTLLLAITWPGILVFLAWRFQESSNGSQFASAFSQALFAVSWAYFPLELLRRVCRTGGLAESHFDWPESTVTVSRTNLGRIMPAGLLAVFATSLLYASDPEHGFDLVERICFVGGMIILAVVLRQVLRPDSGIICEYIAAHPGGWLDRLKLVWYWGSVFAPLVLAGMTIAGYYYTAQQLTQRLFASFVFIVGVQLLRSFLQRLLLVRRRTIHIEQTRARWAEAATGEGSSGNSPALGPDQFVPSTELQTDVDANTQQTQRLIRTGVIAASLVGMWLIWVDVFPALRILDQWPVWTIRVPASPDATPSSGATPASVRLSTSDTTAAEPTEMSQDLVSVTVADIGLAVLIGVVTFVCARNIPGLMEISVLQQLPLDNSTRYAFTSITSYVIVLFGLILAFNAISVGWSKVQWLATALTFGLAFGLQEIFANFVAGLILLFERPLRVGDVVTVDDVSGVVSRIRIRATTITNWDRKEYVIPNKEFITGRVLNWTLSDKTNRIVINVGVAYGSDVERAKELLLQVCHDHPLILDDPPTIVSFEGFGDNSLNLVVRTFLPNLDNRLAVIDALHTAIDNAFRQANIEIAFPQRDLHIRSMPVTLRHS
jgi:potassium efflux system protein